MKDNIIELKKPVKMTVGLTDNEINKLDRLYQQILLLRHPLSEISRKPADCIHHFLRKPMALRWWLKGGIPVTAEEHDIFHSAKGKELDAIIIKKRGEEWYKEMKSRKFKIVKYINYKSVMRYLNGDSADYI